MIETSTKAIITAILLIAAALPCCGAAEDGAKIFQAKCAPCHGKKGLGKTSTKAPSLVSGHAATLSDDQIRALIMTRANGEVEAKPAHTMMKQRLEASQVDALLAYIRELQKH